MKTMIRDMYLAAADSSKIRLVFFVLTLAMFVVAAGAPDAGTDFAR